MAMLITLAVYHYYNRAFEKLGSSYFMRRRSKKHSVLSQLYRHFNVVDIDVLLFGEIRISLSVVQKECRVPW